MAAHLKQHGLASTTDHDPGTNGTLVGTESNAVVEKSFGTTATADLIVQRTGTGQLTVPLTPSATSDATSKQYVDNLAVTGTTWKELVLVQEQLLSGGSGGILQGLLATVSANLVATDTFVLTDGSTTETWTAVAGAPAAFQFQIGGGASATQTNLVAAINADSALWSAVETTGLDEYFAASPVGQFVIYRTAPSTAADRAYGTLSTATDIQVVEFATGDQDYRDVSGTESDLPGSDPAAKRFGFGRLFATLQQNETHRVAEDNTAFTWDADDSTWQNTDTGSAVTEGDGIDVTANKISTDVAVKATTAGQYGAIVNNRTADATGTAGADAGYLAVQTDNSTLEVNASNQLAIKAGSNLATFVGFGSWSSTASPDKEPDLTELNAFFGSGAAGIGNWGFMVEGGPSTGSSNTFLAYKKADGVYHLVEMA
jgi:hypothetical protein